MIALNAAQNGVTEDIARLRQLEEQRLERKAQHAGEATNSYRAGETTRMNPAPAGVDPLGSDADYHYRTARRYYLMVERGRQAVRNHPLVEQGINRLIANLRLDQITLDPNTGDRKLDTAIREKWQEWGSEPQFCDWEQSRNWDQIVKQSFFNQVCDGDIVHLPLVTGQLQTWESHHIRTPFGHTPTGRGEDGIVHGVEVRGGQTVAYHITPFSLTFAQSLRNRGQSRRYEVFDDRGMRQVFYAGFRHRFKQRRGISRLSAPQDAMNGFDDLHYAHTKSALRRALISYIMQSKEGPGPTQGIGGKEDRLPQAGPRYTEQVGHGLETVVVENQGEPAMVFRVPDGYEMNGHDADAPGAQFFEHAALMLTMLAVNLDLPLTFLLLDGSLVNFHGGRMTFEQVKLRCTQLQKDQIAALHAPTYRWQLEQWTTPGTRHFDSALAKLVGRKRIRTDRFKFRCAGWPYVKPLEDAAAEDIAERRNLKSLRAILANRGTDLDEHREEVIGDRQAWLMRAIDAADQIVRQYPELEIDTMQLARELAYGNESSGGVQLSLSAGGESEPAMQTPAQQPEDN